MTFKKLSEFFEKLEATASRNSMVEILAQLFKEASVHEIDKVVYLTQGRVAPLFEPVEFGMAEKMVLKAIAKAFDKPLEKVTDSYKKTGDLGQVAQDLTSSHSSLAVSEVFEKLQDITKSSGEGSVDKKIEILANLFKRSSPLENRFLARIPVDKMRLGFSDMTILEGLSWMFDGTKKHKDKIEATYNIRPDLGFISQEFKKNNTLTVQPKLGTPILCMRAERLTSSEEILEKGEGKMAIEPKLDGLRTQLHFSKQETRLYSRGLENVTAMYPDLVKAAENELKCDEVILDGEAIGFNEKTGKFLPFNDTVTRKRKYDIQKTLESVPVKLIVFDVLFLNGKSLINEPYQKRRELLEKLLTKKSLLVPAQMTVVDKAYDIDKIFEDSVKEGLEGIVAKKLDGVYQAGARGWNWIKYKKSYNTKLADTVDAVVMGLDFGQGKRNKFGVGAFLIGIYDQETDTYKTLSKIGTGLTDDEWRSLKVQSTEFVVSSKPENYNVNKLMNCDLWLKPKLVGEFKADEITKSPMHTSGYALRFPRLEKWREKNPEDTTSLKEIEKLAKLQRGDKNAN